MNFNSLWQIRQFIWFHSLLFYTWGSDFFFVCFFKVHILPLLLRWIKPLNKLTFPLNYGLLTLQGETKRCKANPLYHHLWWPRRSFWSIKCWYFMPQNRDSCVSRIELFFLWVKSSSKTLKQEVSGFDVQTQILFFVLWQRAVSWIPCLWGIKPET